MNDPSNPESTVSRDHQLREMDTNNIVSLHESRDEEDPAHKTLHA